MASRPFVIDYRGQFNLAAAPETVWDAIILPERFEGWWAWLSEFSAEGTRPDTGELQSGSVLRGVVAPPLPYRMRLAVEIDDFRPPSAIDATVHGDLEGHAELRLRPWPGGTRADVAWTIEMRQRAMRVAARVAYPLLRWGHDRVVDATVQSFAMALSRGGPRPAPRRRR